MRTSSVASVLFLAIVVSLAAPMATAQGPAGGTLRWRGSVSRDEVLAVRRDEVRRQEQDDRDDHAEFSAPLPEGECTVFARNLRGHALVSVDEQPNRYNDWTVTVMIHNPRTSPADVEFELLWLRPRPAGGGYFDDGRAAYGQDKAPPRPPPVATRASGPVVGPSGRPIDVFSWHGRVDGADYVMLRGDQVSYEHLSAAPIQSQAFRVTAPLPDRAVRLELVQIAGRGKVRLAEEPSAFNKWRATVLVDDKDDGGADDYEFELRWERPADVRLGAHGKRMETFAWAGRVDGEDVIVAKGNQSSIEHVAASEVTGARFAFSAPLPAREVAVSLKKIDGRGKVTLIEQPSSGNGYAAKVRIEDDKGGADDYKFELSWEQP